MQLDRSTTDAVRDHYDRVSVYYRALWGDHIHHGYWEGDESPAEAQVKLVENLAARRENLANLRSACSPDGGSGDSAPGRPANSRLRSLLLGHPASLRRGCYGMFVAKKSPKNGRDQGVGNKWQPRD